MNDQIVLEAIMKTSLGIDVLMSVQAKGETDSNSKNLGRGRALSSVLIRMRILYHF